MNFTKLGGRRFALTLGAGVVSSVLCWFGKVSGSEYVTLISLTVGAYIAGGTWDNHQIINKAKGAPDAA